MGGRQQEHTFGTFKFDRAQLHDFASARDRRNSKPIGHRFAKGAQVRLHPIQVLRTFHVPAKAGNHFIKDEHNAVFATQGLHLLQVIGPCRLVVAIAGSQATATRSLLTYCRALRGRRLQHHAGDLAGKLIDQCLQRLNVVVMKALGIELGLAGNATR